MSCVLSVVVSCNALCAVICNELCAVLSVAMADQLLDWVTHSTQSWWDGNLATPPELAQGHFLVYTVCCESSESAIKGGEARVNFPFAMCCRIDLVGVRSVMGCTYKA